MGSPRTNSEWGGAEEMSQVRLAGPQSRTVLEASEQIDSSRRGGEAISRFLSRKVT